MSQNYEAYRTQAIASLSNALGLNPSLAASEIDHLACSALQVEIGKLSQYEKTSLKPSQRQLLQRFLKERMQGTPLALVLGNQEFHEINLECSPSTLVPRPETEILVEYALGLLPDCKEMLCADFGTGTGAIAAALAHSKPKLRFFAYETSATAAEVAKRNFSRLRLDERIQLETVSWSQASQGLDLITSNPPYVTSGTCRALSTSGQLHDPLEALDGGPDGLDAIKSVCVTAMRTLRPSGHLLIEHGVGQHHDVARIAAKNGLAQVGFARDLQNLKRVFHAQMPA